MTRRYAHLIAVVFVVATTSGGCGGHESNPFASANIGVNGTWRGTITWPSGTIEIVTTALSQSLAAQGTVSGDYSTTFSRQDGTSGIDSGTVEGTLGTGQTVTLSFISSRYDDWTLTATYGSQTMTGTWAKTEGNSSLGGGSITLIRI